MDIDNLTQDDWNKVDAKKNALKALERKRIKMLNQHHRLSTSKAYLDRDSDASKKARRIEQQVHALKAKRDVIESKLRGMFR